MRKIFKLLKQTIFVSGLGFIIVALFILSLEVWLRVDKGPPPVKPLSSQFYYQSVEIFDPYFTKKITPEGKLVYKCQRTTDIIDRRFENLEFPVHKDKTTKRIFIIGGSVGLPVGATGYLRNCFEDLLPEYNFEIICCARGSYDSYRVYLVEKELLDYSPDLFIILSGNNETNNLPTLKKFNYMLFRVLRKSWLFTRLGNRIKTQPEPGTPEELLANYEKNLGLMVRLAKGRGIPVVLCTLPANIRDYPPRGSPLWESRYFLEGRKFLEKKQYKVAVEKFQQHIATYPQDPFGFYFLAQCLDSLQRFSEAKRFYVKALYLDGARGNNCLPLSWRRSVLERFYLEGSVALADLEQAFERIALDGLIGIDLLVDNCHWWREYTPLVEEEIIRSIIKYNQEYPNNSIFAPLSKWELETWQMKQADYRQFNVFQAEDKPQRAIRIILNAAGQIVLNEQLAQFDELLVNSLKLAYTLDPSFFDDRKRIKMRVLFPILRKFTDVDGNSLIEADRFWAFFTAHLAETLRQLGKYSQALDYFDQAIELNPDLFLAHIGRALTKKIMELGKQADEDFELAGELSPENPLLKYYAVW